MKKIGLIGGTGPESTLMYYRELNRRADMRTGGREMPDIVIESVDFRRAWRYVESKNYDSLAEYLTEKAECLKKAGAEITALTAVTMHAVYDTITERTAMPLVSIPNTVCEYAKKCGYERLGLLGTALTMDSDYMKTPFINAGTAVFVPHEDERALVAKRIFEELENGIVKESTLSELCAVIDNMKKEHDIDAVILGCTELPLILNSENSPVPCIDAVDVHIEKLLDMAG